MLRYKKKCEATKLPTILRGMRPTQFVTIHDEWSDGTGLEWRLRHMIPPNLFTTSLWFHVHQDALGLVFDAGMVYYGVKV